MKYQLPNLPPAPTCLDAPEWGWVDPSGKAIICVKPKHLKYYSHHDSCGKNGLPLWAEIFQMGYIRYAVGKNGDAMFDYLPLADVKRRLVRFIEGHPGITGTIHLDTGGTQPFQEIEVLPLVEALDFLRC